MPPKRKRSETSAKDEAAAPSRTTRSSARLSNKVDGNGASAVVEAASAKNETRNGTGATTKGKSAASVVAADEVVTSDLPDKKKRKTKSSGQDSKPSGETKPKPAKSSSRRTTKSASKQDDDDNDIDTSTHKGPSQSTTSSIIAQKSAATAQTEAKPSVGRAITSTSVFEQYADEDDPDVIGPEGLERLCESAGIPMDGALPLLLAWICDSKEMGKITRMEWKAGMDAFGIENESALSVALNDLDDALIHNKPVRKPSNAGATNLNKGSKARSAEHQDLYYKKDRLWQLSGDVAGSFTKLYTYCFTLAKPEASRNIDMEIAAAIWPVLLSPSYPIISEIVAFISERGTYKGVNKDLWNMMLEFCRTVKPSLEGYDNDGAWPTLLDEFVQWKKEKVESSE